MKIARQIQTPQPKSPQGFDREADVLLVQERFPQAIKAYEQALAKGAGTTGFIKLHRAILRRAIPGQRTKSSPTGSSGTRRIW